MPSWGDYHPATELRILAAVTEADVSRARKVGIEFLDALPEDGERRLMLAVLIDALRTLGQRQRKTQRLSAYRDWLYDRAWIKSENHTDTFSFVNICNALGFDSDYIRRRVLTPAAQGHGQSPPLRLRRYTEKVKETWLRQSRENLRKAAAEHAIPKRALASTAARRAITCGRRRVGERFPLA